MALPIELWERAIEIQAAECLASLSSEPQLTRGEQLMPFYERMRTYALVSPAWSGLAQRLLFREVVMLFSSPWGPGPDPYSLDTSYRDKLNHFADSLKSMHDKAHTPLLAGRILHVAIGRTEYRAFGSLDTVIEILSYLPRVVDLHLTVGDFYPTPDSSLATGRPRINMHASQIGSALSNLQRFTITGVCPPGEDNWRSAVDLNALVRSMAGPESLLEHLAVINVRGAFWDALNTGLSLPRLTTLIVRHSGQIPSDTLHLLEGAPAVLHRLEVQASDEQLLSAPISPAVSARDLHVTMSAGLFDGTSLHAVHRMVLLWPRSPRLQAHHAAAQVRTLCQSARVVELAAVGSASLPLGEVLNVVWKFAAACRALPRLSLVIVHLGGGRDVGKEHPIFEERFSLAIMLDRFPCEFRLERGAGPTPWEEVVRIVDKLDGMERLII